MVIRRIGVWSAARMYGVIMAVVGLLIGLGFAVISTIAGATAGDDMPVWAAGMFGVGAIIFMPIMYGVLGVVSGAIGAVIYNVFAGMVGGLEIETQ